ncbi:DUF3822 family protein [Carboxylicivirga sp. N1Y90]|uniref:DUF3822 family protein n=1 Tax=Carboxylicivirga fragile TaxID=3417571 RepID=UPI003D3427BF|nr:DUF3822 family protein [Marinilabiliaceae bacterium N1Y90]
MSNTYVVDQSFDESITTSYFLSIRSSSDGLSFSVLDPVVNNYIAFVHLPFNDQSKEGIKTQEALLTEKLLQFSYKKVLFMLDSNKATLVPTALYDPAKKGDLFKLNHNIELEDVELQVQKIKMADAWNIFSVPKFLYHLAKTQFESISFYQHYSPFVETCLLSSLNNKQKSIIHIGIHADFFDIVVLESRKLKLCNSFKYNNVNDFIYFVLYTFEQLELASNSTTVLMHGINDRQNTLYQNLKKYLRQTQIAPLSYHFNYSSGLKISESDKQIEHNLFNLAICV